MEANVVDRVRIDNSNFIGDIQQMFEYNQNRLMHLFIFLVQLMVLVSSMIKSILYSSFPTTRDGQFLSPVLRLSESLLLIEYVHKFDNSGLKNRLLALLSLQFLILRLRAFFVRLETAKVNRYSYEKVNTVQLDSGYASEIKFSFGEYAKALYRLYYHQCYKSETLTGERRLSAVQFNDSLKCLDRADRIYYYNQINFNDCFECVDYLSDYRERAESPKHLKLNNIELKRNVGWLKYMLSQNLPDKLNYVAKPEHRVDP